MTQGSPIKQPISRRELIRMLSIGILASGVLAACSKENNHYVVKIDSHNYYDPADLTIPIGATVTWQNIGLLPNTVTCDPTKAQNSAHIALPQNAEPWDSGQLYPGQTWSYTFNMAGNYIYFSQPHESDSMLGTVSVIG